MQTAENAKERIQIANDSRKKCSLQKILKEMRVVKSVVGNTGREIYNVYL